MQHSDLVAILAAIIGALALVLVAVIGVMVPVLISTRKHARQAAYEVSNDHATNLRVEGDERHHENAEKLDRILSEVARLSRSVARLWERSDKHTDQIHDLELTQPRQREDRP